MRPLYRGSVNKARSVRGFKKGSSRSKAVNMRSAPMRGGWRL